MPFKKGQIPWNKKNVTTKCEYCGKVFNISPSKLKKSERELYGRGKYCSKKCKDESKKGKPAWNKGIKGKEYKAHYPKGFGGIFFRNGRQFNGTIKEYMQIHHYIRSTLGKPNKCESCGKWYFGKKIQWANKSGLYKLNKNDWIRLCAKCHYKYDKTTERKIGKLENDTDTKRGVC